jgi:putative ABC transport system substrate-binding protein
MKRRHFVFSAAVIVGASSPARAQSARRFPFKVGILGTGSPSTTGHFFRAFESRMRELGYEEGRDVLYERRWAEGHQERLSSLAQELVRLRVDVILVGTEAAAEAALGASSSVPIVMGASGTLPLGVATLQRPGGNVTGLIAVAGNQLFGKRMELLRLAVPAVKRIVLLTASPNVSAQVRADAKQLGLTLRSFPIRQEEDLDEALQQIAHEPPDAIFDDNTAGASLLSLQKIARFAVRLRLPLVGSIREAAEAGYLVSYGPDIHELFRLAATYVDKILKGATPSDLPVEQPTKFELVLNRTTARALGVILSDSLLLRADEVIE